MEPFSVDKSEYGNMDDWLPAGDIEKVTVKKRVKIGLCFFWLYEVELPFRASFLLASDCYNPLKFVLHGLYSDSDPISDC